MPSCLSTGVKLDRRPCRCASRGVVTEETPNSVKEESRRASQRWKCGGSGEIRQNPRWQKVGRTAALEEKTTQRQRCRTTISLRGGARTGCRRRVLQRKDRVGESRSTSTMIVDDDGDGGDEAIAAARIVRRRRFYEFGFAEEDGLLILPFSFNDRSAIDIDRSRSITDFATYQRNTCICR
ncbi:hypothetical protein Syun_019793 [Stephania yunnanensis]|uniref:Uncharacterized protein n=1 Tax=Stephania yunnanensis TaxID=152371 RepID=A0AAP0IX56_9MAGN